ASPSSDAGTSKTTPQGQGVASAGNAGGTNSASTPPQDVVVNQGTFDIALTSAQLASAATPSTQAASIVTSGNLPPTAGAAHLENGVIVLTAASSGSTHGSKIGRASCREGG